MMTSFMQHIPHLVRRERASLTVMLIAPLAALALAALVNLVLYVAMGKDPLAVFHAILLEPFLSWYSFSEVLLKAGPLLLIAQGLAIGFRAKVFNIGAEGQFLLGAIFASCNPGLVSPGDQASGFGQACSLLGAIGGAMWASITALLARAGSMPTRSLSRSCCRLVAAQLLNYLLLGPWKDPNGLQLPPVGHVSV